MSLIMIFRDGFSVDKENRSTTLYHNVVFIYVKSGSTFKKEI